MSKATKRKHRIRRVGNLRVGDRVLDKETNTVGVIDGFPTRNSVTLTNPRPVSGRWSTAKLGIRDIRRHKK